MEPERQFERTALFVTSLTAFIAPFMISSVNVALPAIQADYNVDAVKLGWIPTSYLLAMAIFLVPFGKIADNYGRKRIFHAGVILYTIASVAAAFVPNFELFIISRVFQGLGGAMFVTTGMAILTSVTAPERRGRAIGILVAAVYVGLAAGPFFGGIMTHGLGWRSLFISMIIPGSCSIYLVNRYLQGEWKDATDKRFDVTGSIVYGVSIFCVVYGGINLPSMKAIVISGIGLLLLILFFVHQNRVENPVFEVKLFRQNRTFLFSSLAALINYAATFGVTFQISLFLQYVKGMSPQTAGTVLVAQPFVMAVLSPVTGRLSDKIEPRILASGGMALNGLGLLALAFLTKQTPVWLIVSLLLFLGFGFSLFSSPNMSAIMGVVERRYLGLASGTVATMRLLGQMVSMALATTCLAIFVGREEISQKNLPAFLQSMQVCLILFSLLCLIGIWFSLFRGKVRA